MVWDKAEHIQAPLKSLLGHHHSLSLSPLNLAPLLSSGSPSQPPGGAFPGLVMPQTYTELPPGTRHQKEEGDKRLTPWLWAAPHSAVARDRDGVSLPLNTEWELHQCLMSKGGNQRTHAFKAIAPFSKTVSDPTTLWLRSVMTRHSFAFITALQMS